jgi:hypothetical protein
MESRDLSAMVQSLGNRTIKFLVWSGYAEDVESMDAILKGCGLRKLHSSELAKEGHLSVIWKRHGDR